MSAPSLKLIGREKPAARRRLIDRAFVIICMIAAFSSILILGVLIASIVHRGWPRLGWTFLDSFPSGNPSLAGFKAALWGSVWLVISTALIALPLGVAAAIFLEEYRPRTGWKARAHAFVQINISNLAGVPSIVYGIIGLTVFVRLFGVLGNLNQYDRLESVETTQNQSIQGIVVEDRAPSIVVDVESVEGATVGEGAEWPVDLAVSRSIIVGGLQDPERSVGTRVTFDLRHDFSMPMDLAFSLEPPPEGAAPVVRVTGTLKGIIPGALTLDTPLAGLVSLPTDEIRSRRTQVVREHEFVLKSGERVVGTSIRSHEGAIVLRSGTEEQQPIAHDQIASYRAIRPLEIGDPDSLFYLRLPLGGSVLAGALTLMLVILPSVIIASQEAMRAVPDSLREGAFASGATRWQMVSRMVLPAAMPGIMTGAILSMSRALGEAAPILVIGGLLFITYTPTNLMSDFAAMPLQIYDWATRPQIEFYSVAAAGIIVLLAVLLVFNAAAIVVRHRFSKPLQ